MIRAAKQYGMEWDGAGLPEAGHQPIRAGGTVGPQDVAPLQTPQQLPEQGPRAPFLARPRPEGGIAPVACWLLQKWRSPSYC